MTTYGHRVSPEKEGTVPLRITAWRPHLHDQTARQRIWKTLSVDTIITGFAGFSIRKFVVLDKSSARRYAVEKVYRIAAL